MRLAVVWALFAGLLLTGPAPWKQEDFRQGGESHEANQLVLKIRDRAGDALSAGQPGDASELLRGMVLGDASGLSAETRNDFRRSSLTHVVAASGQNISLLLALAIPIFSWLGFGLRTRLLLGVVLVCFYVPLAGGEAPIRRAAMMALVVIAAKVRGQAADGWHALGLAGIVTLLMDRSSAGSLGWQLSFSAVAGMLSLGRRSVSVLNRWGVPNPVAEALGMTLAATAATSALIAWRVGQFSLVAIPANLIAGPAVAPAMWLGMIAATVGQGSHAVGSVFAWLAAVPAATVLEVAHIAASPEWASVSWRPSGLIAAVGLVVVVVSGMVRLPGRTAA